MRLIDADALKSQITRYHMSLTPRYISKLVDAEIGDVIDIVDEQPTIEARPVVRGEWKGDGMYMTCPNCGAMFDEDDLINSILLFKKTGYDKSACNFCGNCGADMRAREDDDARGES